MARGSDPLYKLQVLIYPDNAQTELYILFSCQFVLGTPISVFYETVPKHEMNKRRRIH